MNKTIYYVWFGKKPLTKFTLHCIDSWKKYLPGWNIVEINESNFDLSCCKLALKAYESGWYQYVSDYVRLKVIYDHGGLYFDTDVEVIKPLTDLVNEGEFFCLTKSGENNALVNTGLGFYCNKGNKILAELIKQYEEWDEKSFVNDRNFHSIPACPTFNWKVFESFGVKNINQLQNINDIIFYPSEYFEAFNLETREIMITENTYAIHGYTGYSAPKIDRWYSLYYSSLKRKYGSEISDDKIKTKMMLFHTFKYIRYHFRHKKRNKL